MSMVANTDLIELRILGTALDTGELADVAPADFSNEDYGIMWGVLQRYAEDHGAVDHVVLGEHLLTTVGIDRREWLAETAKQAVHTKPLLESYVAALKAYSARGAVTEALSDLTARARTTEDPDSVKNEAIERLRAITTKKHSRVVTVTDALGQSIAELEKLFTAGDMPGIKTGFPRLNEKLGGWQNSDLTLLAARPAVGKTAMMCNMALAAGHGCHVGIVSTEQPAVQIVNRLLAIAGRVPAWKFRSPRALGEDEWPRITQATTDLRDRPITIMDDTSPTIADIERAIDGRGIDVLFVDYAQRISAPGEIYQRISAVAAGLKDIARNYQIPVIALAQINRAGAKNAGMEHLKGSGDLEQEADSVLILERGESENTAVLTVEKNRHGPVGSIDLIFNAPILHFAEAEYREDV